MATIVMDDDGIIRGCTVKSIGTYPDGGGETSTDRLKPSRSRTSTGTQRPPPETRPGTKSSTGARPSPATPHTTQPTSVSSADSTTAPQDGHATPETEEPATRADGSTSAGGGAPDSARTPTSARQYGAFQSARERTTNARRT